MLTKLRKFGLAVLVLAMAGFLVVDQDARQSLTQTPQRAYAGAISSPAWSLTSTTENAENVTYTHTFTTATALQANDEVRISLQNPPGPPVPMPDFFSAAVAAGSTAGLVGQPVQVFWAGPSMNISVRTSAAIAAGSVTVKFSGVRNPAQGGIVPTNTSTLRNNAALDGNPFNPDANGKIVIGTVKLSGRISTDNNCDGDSTDQGETGLAGIRLEVHPGPGSTTFGFWSATTDSNGDYSFAGLSNGAFLFEKSPGVDPNSSSASTISQYAGFDPVNVTISDTPQTMNKIVCKSQKKITGKLVYKDTTTGIKGAMVNAGSMGGGFAMTQTDTSGNFELTMAAEGQVFLMIMPNNFGGQPQGGQGQQQQQQQQNDTDFGSVQRQLAFTQPKTTAETLALGTIETEKASATVSGKIVNADGTPASGGAALIDFQRHSHTPLQIQQDGSFSAKLVPGGTVKLDSFDPQGNFSMPNVRFKVKKGTNDLGTITKVQNNKTVTVTAKRIDGGTERAIENAQAMVFPKEPGPPLFATTNSSGVATVKVPTGFEGRAGVMPGGSFGGGPKSGDGGGPGGPQAFFRMIFGLEEAVAQQQQGGGSDTQQLFPVTGFQKVKAGDSVTAKFDKADKTITVKTVDPDGALVTQGAFVEIRPKAANSGFRTGCPTAGGVGTCYVVAGELEGRVMFPPDMDYVGLSKAFTVTDSGATVSLTVAPKNRTISGSVKKSDGTVIKDPSLAVQVGAFGPAFSFGKYNPTDGSYSVKVSAGKWRIGAMAENPGEGGYVPSINPSEIDTTSESKTFDITLAQLNSKIAGKVTKADGTPVEGVTMIASDDSALQAIAGAEPGPGPGPGGPGPEDRPEFAEESVTDENGNYEIAVVPGRNYSVIAEASALNPPLFPTGLATTTPGANETSTVNIVLSPADMTVKIEANNQDGGNLSSGAANVFSTNGLVNLQVDLDANGESSVSLPSKDKDGKPMVYYVSAGKDSPEDGKKEESPDTKIIGESNTTLSTTLKTVTENDLPKPITTEVSSSSATAVSLVDGATPVINFSMPAGAEGSSSGSSESGESSGNSVFSLTAQDGELPKTMTDTPLGIGARAVLTSSEGTETTSLNGVATLEIKVAKADIPAGITPDDLAMKSYNESKKQWEGIQSSDVKALDASGNQLASLTDSGATHYLVTGTTTHLTDFAVVATTDTTAPAAPTSVKATKVGTGKIKLTWTNPTDSDFASVNIYRSTTKGETGTKIHSAVTGTSQTDTGLTNSTTYYYTVRALDTSGNESSNTDQLAVNPSKLPLTGSLATQAPVQPTYGVQLLVTFLLVGAAWMLLKRYAVERR